MKCETILERLDDYVDGTLSEAEFQEFELHIQGCASCREEERLLRSLIAQAAALPREMNPPRDLWPGIVGRLSLGRGRVAHLGSYFLSPLALAAASVVIALLATQYPILLHQPVPPPGPTQTQVGFDPSLAEAEQQYGRASAALKASLDAKRTSLSPETQKAIDNALQSLRTALQKDPGNAELGQLLIATHRKKLDVLQKVTRLADAL